MEGWKIVKRLGAGVVRRRKRLALLTFLAAALVLGPSAYYLWKEPPRFRTSATILLEARPDRIPIFQEFSPFRPLPVQLAILYSRSLAESVIESLPHASLKELIENPYYVDYMLELRNAYRRLIGTEPEVESPQRRALKELQRARVGFDAKSSGIVDIVAEASKPQVAVDIVNTYIEALLARTRSFNLDDARVSREFLEQQLAQVKKSLRASEEELRTFTSAHGWITIPDRSQAAVARLSQTENALAEVEATKKIVQTRLRAFREKLETQKGPPPPPAPQPVPVDLQRLRNQLTQLETTLLDLRTKYTEEHPRVRLIKDRIAEVQHQLGDVIKETTPLTPAPGAVLPGERVNFGEMVVALETALHSLSAQEEALRRQAESLRQNLSGLSRGEIEYSQLAREVESNRNLQALLSDKLTAARIREQGEMKVVKVIDPPGPPMPSVSEKRLKVLLLALLLAVALGGGVPAAVEWVYRPVESEEDVQAVTGLPVLAVIPRLQTARPLFVGVRDIAEKGRLGEVFLFTEAFRNLRAVVQLTMRNERLRTLLIASPFPGEGKSMVLINLGLAFREAGQRVVLADTDLQRPTLHRAMRVAQNGGVVNVLHAERRVEEALIPVGERMWLVPRGAGLQGQTRGLLATNRLRELVDGLASQGDVVLCDSSPILLLPDNLFLAAAVDGVILVTKAGSSGCRDLARAKSLLDGVGAKVVGVVLNEVPVSVLRRHYNRYYHHYYKVAGTSDQK